MNNDSPSQPELPVWARVDLFKRKPFEHGPYGMITRSDGPVGCQTLEELAELFKKHGGGLVWTPEESLLVVPEEVPELLETIKEVVGEKVKKRWKSALIQAGIIALLCLVSIRPLLHDWRNLLYSPYVGMFGILFLMFGLMPIYETWKIRRKIATLDEQGMRSMANESRFELWMSGQIAPATKLMVFSLIGVYLAQKFMASEHVWKEVIYSAGLDKEKYRDGEHWRLLTAPFMHGGIVHIMFNAPALWFLGKRTEVLAKWPHFTLVFLISMLAGGIVSSIFYEQISVGASGGIMGLLGFLIVFETLHVKLVPKSARRRLFGAVVGMVLIGIIGFQFIDNGAHAGGLFAGMVYAAIVFPRSSSAHRPRMTAADFIAGTVASVVLAMSCTLTIQAILSLS